MSNLTSITQTTKKVGTIILVISTIALLLGLIYFRFKEKEQAPIPLDTPSIRQNPGQKAPGTLDLSSIKANELEFPKELPVFGLQSYQMTDEGAKAQAKNLGLDGDPTRIEEATLDGKQYSWDLQNQRLTLSQTTILHHNNPPEKLDSFTLDQLKNAASDFLQKAPLIGNNLVSNEIRTKYLISDRGGITSTGSFESAQLVEFSFDKKLSGLELVDNTPDSTFTTVRIRKDGAVVYLSSRFFETINQGKNYALMSATEAINQISKGQGKVVQTQILDQYGQALDLFRNQPVNVPSAKITNLSLAYFLPDKLEEPLQPIFVAEGAFQENNETGKIVIYLPAIKTLANSKP